MSLNNILDRKQYVFKLIFLLLHKKKKKQDEKKTITFISPTCNHLLF